MSEFDKALMKQLEYEHDAIASHASLKKQIKELTAELKTNEKRDSETINGLLDDIGKLHADNAILVDTLEFYASIDVNKPSAALAVDKFNKAKQALAKIKETK